MNEQTIKTITLIRVATGRRGTFGVLIDGGIPFALTLEPEWKDNQPVVSCIPAGRYLCRGVNSPAFGYTFEITNVEGRTHILFHCGNWDFNTKGCVLVGEMFEKDGVLASQAGYKEFMFRLKGLDAFYIDIKEAF